MIRISTTLVATLMSNDNDIDGNKNIDTTEGENMEVKDISAENNIVNNASLGCYITETSEVGRVPPQKDIVDQDKEIKSTIIIGTNDALSQGNETKIVNKISNDGYLGLVVDRLLLIKEDVEEILREVATEVLHNEVVKIVVKQIVEDFINMEEIN